MALERSEERRGGGRARLVGEPGGMGGDMGGGMGCGMAGRGSVGGERWLGREEGKYEPSGAFEGERQALQTHQESKWR